MMRLPLRILVVTSILFLLSPISTLAQHATLEHYTGNFTLENAFPNLTFDQPLFLTHAGDGSNRVFVVEKTGFVHVIINDPSVTSSQTFLDISDKLLPKSDSNVGETGLLSLAFHPDYINNGKLYISYVDENLVSTISELTVSNDPNVADLTSERVLLVMQQPQRNHNAGHIAFGLDGMLYISFGDGFSESARDGIEHGDPLGHGQNLMTWFSSVLRIDIENQSMDKEYVVPDDNPFVGNTVGWLEEIYAYGFRNPWRFSFDRETGALWLADVGDKKAEEINIVESGKNYGWALKEATHCFEDIPCDTTQWVNLQDPIFQYLRDVGESITGGYVYRGSELQEKIGHYFYGDFDFSHIWALEYKDGEILGNELIATTPGGISSFGEDESGELYVVDISGKIWLIKEQSATDTERPNTIAAHTQLNTVYPNPFSSVTRITFDVPVPSSLRIQVYDVLGRVVHTLEDRVFAPGRHEIFWNGRDASESPVVGGMYFLSLEEENRKQQIRPVLLLR